MFKQTYAVRMSKEDRSETASGLVNKVAQTLNAYYTESVFTNENEWKEELMQSKCEYVHSFSTLLPYVTPLFSP